MQPSENQVGGLGPSALPTVLAPVTAPGPLPSPAPLTWRAAAMRQPEAAAAQATTRCSERGCVFPAMAGPEGKCLHHLRQSQEPILFSSYQPTRAVLDRGRFGAAAEEVDTSRNRDRRQLVAMREAFLED